MFAAASAVLTSDQGTVCSDKEFEQPEPKVHIRIGIFQLKFERDKGWGVSLLASRSIAEHVHEHERRASPF